MMKLAKVIPLYNASNYKSISLSSGFSKTTEKLMHSILLHLFQFGFRSKNSTLHALISMTESIKKTIDDGMHGCGVFIDLKTL